MTYASTVRLAGEERSNGEIDNLPAAGGHPPAIAAMAAFGGVARADVPVPDQDPFYAVPAGIAGLPNGRLLNSRPISASLYSIPMLASAWQVKYKTLDNHNQPTADVATILVPNTPWIGGGQRPLVSYATSVTMSGSMNNSNASSACPLSE
jgi:hypothetical protein